MSKECKSWGIVLSDIPVWVFFEHFSDACSNFFEPFMSSGEYDGAIYDFLKQCYLFLYVVLNYACPHYFFFRCEEFILSHLSQIDIRHIYTCFIIFISSTHEGLTFFLAIIIKYIIIRIT